MTSTRRIANRTITPALDEWLCRFLSSSYNSGLISQTPDTEDDMATVLCAALHEGIIATRKLVLEEAGHVVVPAMSSPEIIAACQDSNFDVAVLGESGRSQTTREWAALIRVHSPGTRILEVYASHFGATVPSADAWLEGPATPDQLTARVAELAQKKEAHPVKVEEIRELCAGAIKTKKGAEFEKIIRKLGEAINQYAEGRDEKENKPAKAK